MRHSWLDDLLAVLMGFGLGVIAGMYVEAKLFTTTHPPEEAWTPEPCTRLHMEAEPPESPGESRAPLRAVR